MPGGLSSPAAAASVAESSAAIAYQASVTDADGNPLTFSIAGGADAARFAITAAGGKLSGLPHYRSVRACRRPLLLLED